MVNNGEDIYANGGGSGGGGCSRDSGFDFMIITNTDKILLEILKTLRKIEDNTRKSGGGFELGGNG